jgi:DNA (cytosine-5)-methyltransferase 1
MGNAIQTCRPSWVIGENVIGIESMALDSLVSDLEGWGYEVAPPLEIPACAVGHDHRRARIWILAHSHKDSQPGRAINAEAPVMQGCGINAKNVGIPDGVPAGLDRRRLQVLGNAIAPQIAEMIGRAILAAEATLALGERQQEGK